MKKPLSLFLKILIILAWVLLFYLQFERPFLAALTQNVSPNFLPTVFRHSLLWFALLALPLLILAYWKGRFFCWRICPVGLIQDILPSRGKAKLKGGNRLLFLFLLGFTLVSPLLLSLFDPLVTVNRAVVAFKTRVKMAIILLGPPAIIVALSLWRKRFWCFKLCPLGALFDWITLFKTRRLAALGAVDIGRRKALYILGGGLAAGLLWRRFNLRKAGIHHGVIRPPGALPEDDFTDRCIRCGSCLGICLTGGLQPTILEAGLEGVLTPRLVPELGECDEFCNNCGQVCPSQAIRNLPLKEKRNFKMGTAGVNRDFCIAWSQDKLCLICKEYCPYLAVGTLKNKNGVSSPVVFPELCRGCGLCEKNCFARPSRAITVSNEGAGRIIDPAPSSAGNIHPRLSG